MPLYNYKVQYLKGNVSEKDINSGSAGTKIANQVEDTLNKLSGEGYEYYSSTTVSVGISRGCLSYNEPTSTNITVDIFRKEK